jgi:hypothetical protein
MQTPRAFGNSHELKRFLAEQLYLGRLAVVLGAGASQGFGLPDWDTLITNMILKASAIIPHGLTSEQQAEEIWRTCCDSDDIKFAELVRDTLYEKSDTSMHTLRHYALLTSLAALVAPSGRGRAAHVITYNFDDILETYLKYLGYTVDSVVRQPSWNSRADVRVFHPHGLLPSRIESLVEQGIVFTQLDYDRIHKKDVVVWQSLLFNLLCSCTCLFIGLSGKDDNLMRSLASVNPEHVRRTDGHFYWGVRFTKNDDPLKGIWETRGVFQQIVADWDSVPDWILSICQEAALIQPGT